MSFMAAAALGSAAISGISGRRSRKAGDAAYRQAQDAMASQLGKLDDFSGIADKFSQLGEGQFDRYQDMFGPIEDKLNDYYMGLNPDELAAGGNQTAQQQYQQAMGQVNDQMAAQGISGSGIQAQMGMQMGNQMAQTKATNIVNAPHEVANMQQGWMNYGAGRQDQAFNQMNQGVNMQSNLSSMYGNAYSGQANQFNQMGNMNIGLAQQGIQSMGQGLGSAAYFYGKD